MKTYSHLSNLDHVPSDYEITSSQLLYYPDQGFEIPNAVTRWYEKFQKNSGLRHERLDDFHDPRETTYTKYVDLQKANAIVVEKILRSFDEDNFDAEMTDSWRTHLETTLAPLRYPLHGLQMVACYLGQMAPSGRLAIAFTLQAADELRWTEMIAYRMRQIQRHKPEFGSQARVEWQTAERWQPWRRYIEHLLATCDWSEAFVALNMVLKPSFERVFIHDLGLLARDQGDYGLHQLCSSLQEDANWHAQVTAKLVECFESFATKNKQQIQVWQAHWQALLP